MNILEDLKAKTEVIFIKYTFSNFFEYKQKLDKLQWRQKVKHPNLIKLLGFHKIE